MTITARFVSTGRAFYSKTRIFATFLFTSKTGLSSRNYSEQVAAFS